MEVKQAVSVLIQWMSRCSTESPHLSVLSAQTYHLWEQAETKKTL